MVKRVATATALNEIKKAAKVLDGDLKQLRKVLSADIVNRLEGARDKVLENAKHVENNALEEE